MLLGAGCAYFVACCWIRGQGPAGEEDGWNRARNIGHDICATCNEGEVHESFFVFYMYVNGWTSGP